MPNEGVLRGLSLAMTIQNAAIRSSAAPVSQNLSDFRNWVLLEAEELGVYSVSYNAARNTSTLNLHLGVAHEKYIAVVHTKRRKNYTFRFWLASPTGFTCGGYNYDGSPFYHEMAWVTASIPNIDAFQTSYYSPLGMTAWFDEVMAGDGQKYQYSCTFNSGSYDCVFLVFDMGFIKDYVDIVLEVSDVELVEN